MSEAPRVDRRGVIDAIERLLDARRADATICPSDVARAVAKDESAWRALMPTIREVAESLRREGRVRVTRGGHEVDATSPGGPIRIGRR